MRAALFLWITLFLVALSAKEIAVITSFTDFVFFALRTAISSRLIMALFTIRFFLDERRALCAVFVTGME